DPGQYRAEIQLSRLMRLSVHGESTGADAQSLLIDVLTQHFKAAFGMADDNRHPPRLPQRVAQISKVATVTTDTMRQHRERRRRIIGLRDVRREPRQLPVGTGSLSAELRMLLQFLQ